MNTFPWRPVAIFDRLGGWLFESNAGLLYFFELFCMLNVRVELILFNRFSTTSILA